MLTRLRRRSDGIIEVAFRYNPDVVASLREGLPKYSRWWSPETKAWCVDAKYTPKLLAILGWHDLTVQWETLPSTPPPAPAYREPWATLYLVPDAPLPVAEAAYRAVAKLVHPDGKNGSELATSSESMKRANAAIEAIRERSR